MKVFRHQWIQYVILPILLTKKKRRGVVGWHEKHVETMEMKAMVMLVRSAPTELKGCDFVHWDDHIIAELVDEDNGITQQQRVGGRGRDKLGCYEKKTGG